MVGFVWEISKEGLRESLALSLSVRSGPKWDCCVNTHNATCEIWVQSSNMPWVCLGCFVASLSSRTWRSASAYDIVIILWLNISQWDLGKDPSSARRWKMLMEGINAYDNKLNMGRQEPDWRSLCYFSHDWWWQKPMQGSLGKKGCLL